LRADAQLLRPVGRRSGVRPLRQLHLAAKRLRGSRRARPHEVRRLSTALLLLLAASPLVEAKDVVPSLVVDLRYATDDNFLHKAVYPKGSRCLLLADAAKKLKVAADALAKKGFRLKAW